MVELDESLEVAHQQTCKLPPGLLHDVTSSENFYVVSRFGALNVLKVLWGAAPVFSAIQFNEKTPVLHLIPRRGGKPLTVPLPKRMHSHFFNAFEEDGSVVVDTIGYPWCATASRWRPCIWRGASCQGSRASPPRSTELSAAAGIVTGTPAHELTAT